MDPTAAPPVDPAEPPLDETAGPGYRTQAARVERDQELNALFKEVRDYAIFTVNPNGLISSWHEGAERIKGYTASEAIGMPFARLFTEEDRRRDRPAHEMRVAADEGEYRGDGQRVRKNGELFEASVVLTALRGPSHELLGYLKLTQDISARKQFERDREVALEAADLARAMAEHTSRSMSEFLATVSHELRTPLSAILGWAQVLQRHPEDRQRLAHGLAAITRNARLQTRLIEDLLDTNRLETGRLRLGLQRVELPVVINAAVEVAAPAARAKGVKLRTELDATAAAVDGDAARLEQVVGNLLSNAVKFTPAGGQVTVALTQTADDTVEIAVSDTGQGIEPAFLADLFERFRQQEGGTTRRHGGLGLGLTIVRQLVQQHGGSVRAESPGTDRGSTFVVSLPATATATTAEPEMASMVSSPSSPSSVQPVRHHAATGAASPQHTLPLEGTRLVLVDDDVDGRDMAAILLRSAGAEVFAAAGAVEGFAQLREQRPNLLISDIGMPGHDGHDLIGWVRALDDAHLASTPALALTAFAREEDERRALAAGFAARLVKPVEPAVLLAVVSSWLRREPQA